MKLIRNIIKGASLTTALFVFQACYGSPAYIGELQEPVRIKVLDATNGEPVNSARVRLREDDSQPWGKTTYSNEDGVALIYLDDELLGKDMELEVVADIESYQRMDTLIIGFGMNDLTLNIKRSK